MDTTTDSPAPAAGLHNASPLVIDDGSGYVQRLPAG